MRQRVIPAEARGFELRFRFKADNSLGSDPIRPSACRLLNV